MDIKDYLHLYLGNRFVVKLPDGSLSEEMILTPVALGAAYSKKDHIDPLLLLRPMSKLPIRELGDTLEVPVGLGLGSVAKSMAEITLILINKNVDVFGLIEAGLAIDETTLNK